MRVHRINIPLYIFHCYPFLSSFKPWLWWYDWGLFSRSSRSFIFFLIPFQIYSRWVVGGCILLCFANDPFIFCTGAFTAAGVSFHFISICVFQFKEWNNKIILFVPVRPHVYLLFRHYKKAQANRREKSPPDISLALFSELIGNCCGRKPKCTQDVYYFWGAHEIIETNVGMLFPANWKCFMGAGWLLERIAACTG